MESNTITPIPHFDEVVLTDNGKLTARVTAPQIGDGFSSYMRGRLAEDIPLYVQRIDTHCSVSHHLAAVGALDRCYRAAPPEKALTVRRGLAYSGVYFHHLEQLFLSRLSSGGGISGLIATDETISAEDVFDALMRAQQAIAIFGGRGITPERGMPGGLTKGITDDELPQAKDIAAELLNFALRVEETFRASGATWVKDQDLRVPLYSLATVDSSGSSSLYDGVLRIVDPEGKETAKGGVEDILPLLVSWKDELPVRVGPLARLNVGVGAVTPQAASLQKHLFDALGQPPIHLIAAGYWAMMIELVQAAELLVQTVEQLETGDSGINSPLNDTGEGMAAIEGASGTLIHRYVIDKAGIVREAQVLSASVALTAEVNAALSVVVNNADGVSEALLESVVDVIRAYQPAFLPTASLPLRITMRDADGKVTDQWRKL